MQRSCCWVTTLSAEIMSLCTESQGFPPPPFVLPVRIFFPCFTTYSALPLLTLNFTFTSQLLHIRRSFRTPAISSVFTSSGQFSIANKLLEASSWRGTAFLGIIGQSYCVLIALLASASSSWWLWEEPGEGGLECSLCNGVSFILLRASWISTGRGPGELLWVHMPGTSAVKHWLPAQLVTQAVVNLLAQTQCTQTVAGTFLNWTGTD